MHLLPIAITALAVLALLAAERAGSRLGIWIAKPIASLGFVALALAVNATAHPYGRWIFAGLVLGAIGDVFLIPRSSKAFLIGLGSFLLGHVAYAVAFAVHGSDLTIAAAALLPVLVLAALILRWLLPHVSARMKPPVLCYVAVICAMVVLALGAYRTDKADLILVGAIAFFLSDISVARNRFVAPGFDNKIWGQPLYFGAQLLLAFSAAA